MKTTLRTKLLQHFAKKKHNNEGFTLIELLVVIIIVGILAAIALPSFLNQASKAREAGAKTNLGAINRAQQAYRVEKGEFAANFTDEDFAISAPSTEDYEFEITSAATASKATATATTDNADLDPFIGCVNTEGQQKVTDGTTCALPGDSTSTTNDASGGGGST